ncbi:hypothetical protein J5Y04_40275 [Kitasatospora sp. RG8]|uniref:hypothetical protein n=1 Tax=Kitasatospora sp. RG8 TaxID=2820815 RepID=UPI001ADF6827|nr:hypothetical protein [Kitasatospora sp. RG8]MBP0455716.1 hypothetical protein [Kitasatospora sp. RG8]
MTEVVFPNEAGALLQMRAAALLRETGVAIEQLGAIKPAALRKRVELRLATDLESRRQDLRKLLDGGGGPLSDGAWNKLHRLRTELDALFEETLALMEGAALRKAGLDGGCLLADRLADEISVLTPENWNAFTVLDTDEFYAGSTRVIRVRFPADSFWDLPVVAHEFGHFVGTTLTVMRRGKEVLALEEELADAGSPDHRSWLHESFADVFATYVIGPAYGLSCAFERFNPVAADKDDDHPAPNTRLALIEGVLAAYADGHPHDGYDRMISRIHDVWAAQTTEAGVHGTIGLREPFGRWLAFSLGLLRAALPLAAYDGWWRTTVLAKQLGDGERVDDVTKWSLRDIVNAAWLARTVAPGGEATDRIAQRAHALAELRCLEVRDVRHPK